MTDRERTFQEMVDGWREARTSKSVFMPAQEYPVLESCATEAASVLERLRELSAEFRIQAKRCTFPQHVMHCNYGSYSDGHADYLDAILGPVPK